MEKSPMVGIKYALSFVLGAIYVTLWWLTIDYAVIEDNILVGPGWIPYTTVPIVLSTIVFFVCVVVWFLEHWGE